MSEGCSYCKRIIGVEDHDPSCPDSEETKMESETFNAMFSQGWECPRCTRVFSPMTSSCSFCNKEIDQSNKNTGG